MSPTERLRRMLDERGVEWDVFEICGTEYVHWTNGDGLWCAASVGEPSKLHVNILNATPEQTIAATLPESDAGGRSMRSATPRCADCSRKR